MDQWSDSRFDQPQSSDHWRSDASRGLSLLRALPADRNCQSADIPDDYCICQRETLINITDPMVSIAARSLLEHINNRILDGYDSRCARLQLHNIQSAQKFVPNPKTVQLDSSMSILYGVTGFYINYRVTIETTPGYALFEATLRRNAEQQDDDLFVVSCQQMAYSYYNFR